MRRSVAFCGELELAIGPRIALDAVMEGSVALDRSSRGRWREALCEDESRRCVLMALRVSREKDAMTSITWQVSTTGYVGL